MPNRIITMNRIGSSLLGPSLHAACRGLDHLDHADRGAAGRGRLGRAFGHPAPRAEPGPEEAAGVAQAGPGGAERKDV
jgi:hypothetical protein